MRGAAEFDVLVVGAGPAGAVAARVLAQAGRAVLLADEVKAGDKIGESLPGAARPLLRDLGLLPWLEQSGPIACPGNLSAWGSSALAATDFIRDPNGEGWHLDRARFDACLRQAAQEAGAVWQPWRLQTLQREQGIWRAHFDEGACAARWVIDASGRRSIVAQRLGVERLRESSRIAVYAWGDEASDAHPDRRTLVETVEGGWWYTAPLPGGRRVASFHTEPAVAARVLRTPGEWLRLLAANRHVRRHCRQVSGWTPPRGADAGSSGLPTPCGEGWLAVGDAALAFDPISSQGVFNALYTGLRGAQAAHIALDGDPRGVAGYLQVLRRVQAVYRQRVAAVYAEAEQVRSPVSGVRLPESAAPQEPGCP